MSDYKFQGTLDNGEAIYTDPEGNILIEKDHQYLVEATPDEKNEAMLIMASLETDCELVGAGFADE